MQLHRVVLSWAGTAIIGQAVTVLHYDGSNQSAPPVAAIKTALNAVSPMLPSGASITVPQTGDTIEDTTGALTGVWSTTGGGNVAGAASGTVAAGVGACVSWSTSTIVNGLKGPRKLRGRTFIVPFGTGYYDTDGTLSTNAVNALNDFGTALRASGPLAIWHRPRAGAPASGGSGPVVTHRVRDKVAFLSSRRD